MGERVRNFRNRLFPALIGAGDEAAIQPLRETIAVTIGFGPVNYLGGNPELTCH